jgi:hypothetical protein
VQPLQQFDLLLLVAARHQHDHCSGTVSSSGRARSAGPCRLAWAAAPTRRLLTPNTSPPSGGGLAEWGPSGYDPWLRRDKPDWGRCQPGTTELETALAAQAAPSVARA